MSITTDLPTDKLPIDLTEIGSMAETALDAATDQAKELAADLAVPVAKFAVLAALRAKRRTLITGILLIAAAAAVGVVIKRYRAPSNGGEDTNSGTGRGAGTAGTDERGNEHQVEDESTQDGTAADVSANGEVTVDTAP